MNGKLQQPKDSFNINFESYNESEVTTNVAGISNGYYIQNEEIREDYDFLLHQTVCLNASVKGNLSPAAILKNLSCFLTEVISLNSSPSYPKSIFNFSLEQALEILLEKQKSYLDRTTEIMFIFSYVCLIIFGVAGNVMVGHVIWRKKVMRTARNLYIINLTISDLTMCLVSMPFTMIGLIYKEWALGSVICKLVPVIQGTNILVSTATIVAIAADRYVTIVRIGRSNRKKWHVAGSLVLIWSFSFLFTLPLYSYYFVEQAKLGHIILFHKCVERWPSKYVKEMWVVMLLITQYLFPILVLSVVHGSIKRYLGRHMTMRRNDRRAHREIDRNKKTTILLSTIAVAFAVSWLPWHVVNLLADFHYSKFNEPKLFYTVFGSCHIIAMSSACFNPVLYGWLNTNLRRELLDFMPSFLKKLKCLLPLPYGNDNISNTNNKTNNNNMESPTRQAESISLYVYQPQAIQVSIEDQPIDTTSIYTSKEI